MNTNKFIYVSTAALLAGGLMLVGCERPNTDPQVDGVGLALNTEDGTGDDFNVSQAVHTLLQAERRLQNMDIEVVTRKGDVRLTGTVDTQEQKELAERIAVGTAGVHGVNNELQVRRQ